MRAGLPAACLNSSLGTAEQAEVRPAVADGSLRLLYVSPERLERLSQELRQPGHPAAAAGGGRGALHRRVGSRFPSQLSRALAARAIPPGPAAGGRAHRKCHARRAARRSPVRCGSVAGFASISGRSTVAISGSARCASASEKERLQALLALLSRRRCHGHRLRADPGQHRSCGARAARTRGTGPRRTMPASTKATPGRHAGRFPARPGRHHRGHLRLRHGHRQALRPAGGALDSAAHAGSLLPGGRSSRARRRVRPLCAALAPRGCRSAPPPARCHLSRPAPAGAHLV